MTNVIQNNTDNGIVNGESLTPAEDDANTQAEVKQETSNEVANETQSTNNISENSTQIQEIINVFKDYRVYFHNGAPVTEGQLIADLFGANNSIKILAVTEKDLNSMGGNLDTLSKIINDGLDSQSTTISFIENGAENVSDVSVSSFDSVIEAEVQKIIDDAGEIKTPATFILSNSEEINNVVSVRLEAIANAETAKQESLTAAKNAERQEAFGNFAKGAGIVGGGALGGFVLVIAAVKLSRAIAKKNSPEARERRKAREMSKIQDSHNMVAGEELAFNIEANFKMRMDNPELSSYALDKELLEIIQKYNRMREIMKKKGLSQNDLNETSIIFSSLLKKLALITGYNYYVSAIEQWNMSENKEKSNIASDKATSARRAIEIISEHIDETLQKFDTREEIDLKVAMKSIEYIKESKSIDQVFKRQTGIDTESDSLPINDDPELSSDEKIEALRILNSLPEDEIEKILLKAKKNQKSSAK